MRADGVTLGFTDHDRTLTFDGTDFEPESGFAASEVRSGSDLSVDAQDAQGVLSSDRITETDILDGRIVPAAVKDIGLRDPVGGQHALRVLRIDRKVRARPHFGGRKTAFRLEISAVERQGSVMVGKAERHPISPHDPPAPGERRRALVKMGL